MAAWTEKDSIHKNGGVRYMKNKYTTITRAECEARITEKLKEIETIAKQYDPNIDYLDMTLNKGHVLFHNKYWDSACKKLDYFECSKGEKI